MLRGQKCSRFFLCVVYNILLILQLFHFYYTSKGNLTNRMYVINQ